MLQLRLPVKWKTGRGDVAISLTRWRTFSDNDVTAVAAAEARCFCIYHQCLRLCVYYCSIWNLDNTGHWINWFESSANYYHALEWS